STPTILAAAPTATTIRPGLPLTEADVPRVTVEEARAAFERGEAVIVDVRSEYAFAESHIPGAISIPLNLIEEDPSSVRLDKSTWIIAYCA
ncbi:MAG: rhodanese-like domain-containing protein, partial [Chloroflexota bacterium]